MFVIFVVVAVGTVNGLPALAGYIRPEPGPGVFGPVAVIGGVGGLAAAMTFGTNTWSANNAADILQTMVPLVGACSGALLGYVVADVLRRLGPRYRLSVLSEEVMMVGVVAAFGLVAVLAFGVVLFFFSEGMQSQPEVAALIDSLAVGTGRTPGEVSDNLGGALFAMLWTRDALLTGLAALAVSAGLSGAFWRYRFSSY